MRQLSRFALHSSHFRLFSIWVFGALVGTLIMAITSPWFVRSYLPRRADPVRRAWTLPEGNLYRWRSEGYADTQIGPLGMPGKTSLEKSNDQAYRVALWGDSQAEGVCVADREKLFAQAEAISGGRLVVLPLARSGDDAADWVTQMPLVEQELELDAHVLLIVDLPDLATSSLAPVPAPSDSDDAPADAVIAERLPAIVIQAARHLLVEADNVTPRQLRFNIGPLPKPKPVPHVASALTQWDEPLRALRAASRLPIVVLYAPLVPQIVHGKVQREDPRSNDFAAMKASAETCGVEVADTRGLLVQSADQGRWPHGFHNGVIGSGHLNPQGYAVIAAELVRSMLETSRQGN